VIDLEGFARGVKPEWFDSPAPVGAGGEGPVAEAATLGAATLGAGTAGPATEGGLTASGTGRATLVLLAEDSAFFRARVREMLAEAGYTVLEAQDGAQALEIFAREGGAIEAVVADIEMPNIDGFELTRRIRATGSKVPVLALTSLASDEDRKRGIEAGVDDFQVKLDKDELLKALASLVHERGKGRKA
jgi:CheY-like chemotaxis protein